MISLDQLTNAHVPRSIVPRLPHWLQRWVGGHSSQPIPDYLLVPDIMIGTFVSLLTIEAVFMHSGVFKAHHAPSIVASYGASAILAFNAHTAPLAQPRSILFGHFISALMGVCVMKLFSLSETGRDHYWVGGPLAVAIASIAMSLCNCVHPPSGATALIPLIDSEIREMSWWYLPAHLVSSVLLISIACVTNNVLRSYPLYWWTAYKRKEPVKTRALAKEVIVPEGVMLTQGEMEFLDSIKEKALLWTG